MPIIDTRMRAISSDGVKRPYLDILYINPHSKLELKATALIDTGADCCVVPHSYAEILGHNYVKGNPRNINGVNGQSECFSHTMKIEIPNFCTNEIQIIFSPGIKEPILGVRTFLSNFLLQVDYPNERFSLHEPQKLNESISSWPLP